MGRDRSRGRLNRPGARTGRTPRPAAPAFPAAGSRYWSTTRQNIILAATLSEFADLLEQQQADEFRIAAYRRAAQTLEALDRPASEILASEGPEGLMALPGIGRAIASALTEMLTTGRWSQLDRVRGTLDAEALFRTIPGIGPTLAERLSDELHVETLEGLEMAAHDGRLEALPGFGARRAQMVRSALAQRLGRPRLWQLQQALPRPPAAMLLEIDREYRARAEAGSLPTIAPRRFNPGRRRWLPILHTRRGDWEFTVLFSNTARAHELERIGDWVVIYYRRDGEAEGQCTVVTERRGPMAGSRVVRGREAETPIRAQRAEAIAG